MVIIIVKAIYNGLYLQGDLYYEDKIKKIIEFLDNLTSDEYDKELVKSTKAFMNELYNKIDLGNKVSIGIVEIPDNSFCITKTEITQKFYEAVTGQFRMES